MSLKMDNILDDHPYSFVLPPAVAVEFTAAGFVFLNAFSSLAATYNAHGDMLFNLTPKAHMLAHICLRAGSF